MIAPALAPTEAAYLRELLDGYRTPPRPGQRCTETDALEALQGHARAMMENAGALAELEPGDTAAVAERDFWSRATVALLVSGGKVLAGS